MASIRSIALAIIIFALSSAANAGEPTRIDASSDASAQASWDRMLAEASDETKNKLRVALLELNTVAATENHLYGIAFHAALQDPQVFRIKDKVAGLSAEQVIELAKQTSGTK